MPAQAGRRGWCGCLCWVELLGNIGDCAFEGDFSPRGIKGNNIGLCSDNVNHNGVVFDKVLLQFREPAGHFLEALLVGDVVTEKAGIGAAVVETRDAAETFLAGCVPDLKSNDGIGGAVEDAFGHKGGAHSRGCSGGVEVVLDIAIDKRGFADAWTELVGWSLRGERREKLTLGAEDNNFSLERRAHGGVEAKVGYPESWICMFQRINYRSDG